MTDRCVGEDCQDSDRPIVILSQGVTYHYDGGDKEKAYEEAWNKFERGE
jgi:hypothetical protein